MITYDREKHELLVVNWYIQELAAKPDEFANLFAKPLRNLTEILYWCSRTVKLFFEIDAAGLWIASWVEPVMSGAYWGVWVRADKRHSKAMLSHVNESLDLALQHFPVLMAPTKQPRLKYEMLRLGWIHQGDVPHLFDGSAADVYYMDKESRDVRKRWRQNLNQFDIKSLRSNLGRDRVADVADGEAGLPDLRITGGGSLEDGGRERADTVSVPRRRRRKGAAEPVNHGPATTLGAKRSGGN